MIEDCVDVNNFFSVGDASGNNVTCPIDFVWFEYYDDGSNSGRMW